MVSLVVLYAAVNRFEEQVLVLASRRQPREEDRIGGAQELAYIHSFALVLSNQI